MQYRLKIWYCTLNYPRYFHFGSEFTALLYDTPNIDGYSQLSLSDVAIGQLRKLAKKETKTRANNKQDISNH